MNISWWTWFLEEEAGEVGGNKNMDKISSEGRLVILCQSYVFYLFSSWLESRHHQEVRDDDAREDAPKTCSCKFSGIIDSISGTSLLVLTWEWMEWKRERRRRETQLVILRMALDGEDVSFDTSWWPVADIPKTNPSLKWPLFLIKHICCVIFISSSSYPSLPADTHTSEQRFPGWDQGSLISSIELKESNSQVFPKQ